MLVKNERYLTLDALRGIAVMGILLMNIVAFAMPEAAYVNPAAYGGLTTPDVLTWATMFVLVDSKMRGLFSILFGASMLLVYERAEEHGEDGRSVHFRRMAWLLLFGLLHFYLFWFGDILTLYAVCGLLGLFLVHVNEAQLRRAAVIMFSLTFIALTLFCASLFALKYAAQLPGAGSDAIKSYAELVADIGGSPTLMATEVALHQGGWLALVVHKLTHDLTDPLTTLLLSGTETLGLMAIGMLLLRNGFLTGSWSNDDYGRILWRCYLLGIPPLILLALWNWSTGFEAVTSLSIFLAFSIPFRVAVTIGHAALAVLLIKRFAGTQMMARIEAAGKAAFSNYLGTTLLMTGLFYGWGLGQFGEWSRWQVYLIVPVVWAIMLLWSKPWLDRFQYGPLEWLWRSLARGEKVPFRRRRLLRITSN